MTAKNINIKMSTMMEIMSEMDGEGDGRRDVEVGEEENDAALPPLHCTTPTNDSGAGDRQRSEKFVARPSHPGSGC